MANDGQKQMRKPPAMLLLKFSVLIVAMFHMKEGVVDACIQFLLFTFFCILHAF